MVKVKKIIIVYFQQFLPLFFNMNSLLVSARMDEENYLFQEGVPSSIVSVLPTSEIDKLYVQ